MPQVFERKKAETFVPAFLRSMPFEVFRFSVKTSAIFVEHRNRRVPFIASRTYRLSLHRDTVAPIYANRMAQKSR
jgi:hypothetical protein